MALTVACAHCSGLGAACVSFGTGRSAHAFVLSPLVPVVGVLCSAQSLRVTDSVGDVLGVRRGEPTDSKVRGPAPNGLKCKRLSNLFCP
jgi:hypothetical protein